MSSSPCDNFFEYDMRNRAEMDEIDDTIHITPPPSPSPSPPPPHPHSALLEEISHLKRELEEQREKTDKYKKRSIDLRDKLEEANRKTENYRDRMTKEIKKTSGLRTTSALATRLDEADYKTIFNTTKYHALKKEATSTDLKEPLVTLTKSGIIYLKENVGLNVDKNGVKRLDPKMFTPISNARHKDAQRFDNRLITLTQPFYNEPKKSEPRPKRNPKNYEKKANLFGHRGDRHHFDKVGSDLEREPQNMIDDLLYFDVFKCVKSILDSKQSVTNELY